MATYDAIATIRFKHGSDPSVLVQAATEHLSRNGWTVLKPSPKLLETADGTPVPYVVLTSSGKAVGMKKVFRLRGDGSEKEAEIALRRAVDAQTTVLGKLTEFTIRAAARAGELGADVAGGLARQGARTFCAAVEGATGMSCRTATVVGLAVGGLLIYLVARGAAGGAAGAAVGSARGFLGGR